MKPEDEDTDLLIALKNALEWMGRKPKGRNERMSFMFAEGFVRNAIVHLKSKAKANDSECAHELMRFTPVEQRYTGKAGQCTKCGDAL